MADGGTKAEQGPSFFKVLVDENRTKLKLPPTFVRKNMNWSLLETISLKLDSGISWNVKMERNETGCYFAKGWAEFARGLRLEAGDFLVFRLIREREFKVAVFGGNCCEKDLRCYAPSGTKDSGYQEKVKTEPEETDLGNSSGKSMNSSFQKRLSRYDRLALMVPKRIEREFQLGTTNKSVTIKDLMGNHCCVKAKVRSSSKNLQVFLTTGWSDLVRANGLEAGDTIELKFLGTKGGVVSLRVLSKARPRTAGTTSRARAAQHRQQKG